MSDATYIELPPQPCRRPLWRSWRGILLAIVILGVIVAGWFSWWLSEGKLVSSMARVDATVYTVDAAFPTTIDGIFVRQGDAVQAGQALAQIDPTEYASQLQQSMSPLAPAEPNSISGRLAASAQTERQMSTRLEAARAEEARYQQVHQQRVTEHVRAQLYLRSINQNNWAAWQQAVQAEQAARMRMEAARADFENASKMRAAVDTELTRIRYELARKKVRASTQPEKTAPPPAHPPVPNIPNMLYSPVNGQIFSIDAQPGEKVGTGQTIFIILPAEQADARWIQAWFPASARAQLKKGQKAQIAIQNQLLPGIVQAIDPEDQPLPGSNTQKRYVPVKIQIPDQAILEKITPGATAACQIQTHYLLSEEYF